MMHHFSPKPEEIMEAKRSHLYKKAKNVPENKLDFGRFIMKILKFSVAINAVKACNRNILLWSHDFSGASDPQNKIKKWIGGIKSADLITDPQSIVGYEADFVIYFGDVPEEQMPAYFSRCRGQFIHIGKCYSFFDPKFQQYFDNLPNCDCNTCIKSPNVRKVMQNQLK